jgi:hypothetical protein
LPLGIGFNAVVFVVVCGPSAVDAAPSPDGEGEPPEGLPPPVGLALAPPGELPPPPPSLDPAPPGATEPPDPPEPPEPELPDGPDDSEEEDEEPDDRLSHRDLIAADVDDTGLEMASAARLAP